jgi:hypothetical protein
VGNLVVVGAPLWHALFERTKASAIRLLCGLSIASFSVQNPDVVSEAAGITRTALPSLGVCYRLEAREVLISETPRLHHACGRQDSRVAAFGARAARGSCGGHPLDPDRSSRGAGEPAADRRPPVGAIRSPRRSHVRGVEGALLDRRGRGIPVLFPNRPLHYLPNTLAHLTGRPLEALNLMQAGSIFGKEALVYLLVVRMVPTAGALAFLAGVLAIVYPADTRVNAGAIMHRLAGAKIHQRS